ncbi:MAG: molybdopterin-synthase adenylyltransferase MoeB, partial [Gammaproteobacteria bacterium]
EGSPCYRCLYQDDGTDGANCALEGVVAPLVGVIGAMQAQETMNVLLGRPALVGRLLLFDGRRMDWRNLKLSRNSGCPVCGGDESTNPLNE